MRLSVRALGTAFCVVLVGAALWPAPASAQVAGQNVNMVSGTKWPNGDPFLQRQNEPSMAVSTRNPMHILAGANDYRSVDLQQVLTGGAETGDAWLGLFKSFDGGFTWQSTLSPGCPYAVSQCTDSGALSGGYQAAADPVVRAGTNGMFYYAGLAFDRATSATTASSVSTIFVARYNDLNNNEQLDPITYIDTHIVASGNSAQFLDKPSMAVDIPRAGAATCSFTANEPGVGANGGTLAVKQSFPAGVIYLAYTDFLAATKANTTPTHLMVAHSTDCGVTWSTPVQINTGTTTSQGSAIAVNPITGAVYVAWRQFASTGVSNAIMIAQSTNAGKTFGAPVQISTFQPFDQGTTLTSIRTNAYPALTTDMFGFVYVAFSARGVSASGDARIVAAGSLDGTYWTPAIMVDNPPESASNPSGRGHQIMPAMTFANGRLTLLYYDLRLDHYAGFYTPNPSSIGNYTEMLEPEGELAPPSPEPSLVFTPYIDDAGLTLRRHTLDLRVLELGIFPTITLGPSVLVSQYAYGCCVNPETPDIEQYKFNVPNLPLFDSGQEAFLGDYLDIVPTPMFVPSGSSWTYNFMPSVNPLFHATWTDNRDVVPPPPGGSWENYTAPVVAGAISVETGQPLPACVPGEEGMRNQNIYTSQITGGLVVGAPGNAKPLGTTTYNGQTVPFQRAFPVEAQNSTSQPLNVRFTISNQPTGGTASFLQFSKLTTLDVTVPAYSSVSRSVFATSTNTEATITVNVAQITAIGGSVVTNGLSSTAVLNPDITNPNITNPNITNPNITNPNITNDEVTNPNITNPNITNPNITNPNITNPNITNTSYLNPNITNPNITNLNVDNVSATNPNITNPNITNPDITNPNITNPNITNPDITNGSIQDVTYPITNTGNTTSSYTVKTATTTTVPGGIVLQLLINKLYQTPVAVNCVLGVQTHWITVANITNPMLFTASNPNITNPDITNATPDEASVTLAPGETAYITIRVVNPTPTATPFNPLTAIVPVAVPQAVNTTTVLANPGNPNLTAPPVYPPVSILTTALPATDRNDAGYAVQLVASGGKPGADTWSIVSGALPPGISLSASGLVSGTGSTPGSYTVTIQAADSSSPQNTGSMQYTLNVSVTPLTAQTVMPAVDGVVGQSYAAYTLTVTGGTGPYTWTATGLPPGLAINPSSGQITGTPTTANPTGTSVTITATDAATPPESVPYTTMIRVGNPIVITPLTLPAGTIGTPYAFQLSATGGIGGLVFGPPSPATGISLGANGALTIADPLTSSISFSITVHDQSNLGTAPGFQIVGANYTILFTGQVIGNVTFTAEPVNSTGGQVIGGSPVVVHVADNTDAPIAAATVVMAFNGTPACSTATLSGTLSVQTDTTGNATFTNLSVDHGQNGYSLMASVSGLSAISIPFNVSGFCDTGSMVTARRNHMVLALPNGKILVTGGAANADASGVLATAELYDPVAHSFSMTAGPMSAPRADHTVTLLTSGEVLVTGGFNDTVNAQASADLYNQTTNTFTPVTAQMTTPRAEHAATLLANGTVLITGGNDNNGNTLASAEIYDPVTNTFAATANVMNSVRQAHHADLLPNGKVLISGGLDGNNNALASAEIFDPVAGTFTPTGNMTTARGNHSSALLYNGQILVAGGLTGPGTALVLTGTAELFNPSTGMFTPTASMSIPRGHYAGIVLDDGTIFISGGATLPAGTNADVYNPATQTFSTTGNFTMVQTGAREAVAPDGTVLLASGVNNANPVVTVPNSELYYPAPLPAGIVVTTPTALPTGFVNQPYTQVLLEHGGVGQLTWTSSSLPAGFSLSPSGILTGTAPAGTGPLTIPVTASDSSVPPQSTAVTFTLQVTGSLAITTTSLPNGVVGVAYNNPIVTTGGTLPVSFSLATASFPPGLTITQPATGTQTGALAGTPTTAGTYNFSETVIDSSTPPQTATQNYTVTILPVFAGTTPNTLPQGTVNTAYSQSLTSTGGIAPITYQFLPGTAFPPGLSISPSGSTTAVLSGTPTSAGIFTFAYQATDSSVPPQSYTEQLTLTIGPQPPTNLNATPNNGAPSVSLSWNGSPTSGVTSYNVYRSLTSGTGYTLVGSSTTTSFLDESVTYNIYYYVVTAVANGAESIHSNEAPVTLTPAP
ncbi:MAG: kelch repeat-containing protein [Candidatus Acidiferrum sp.]